MRVRDAIWNEIVRSYTIWLIVAAFVFVGLEFLPDDFSRLIWVPVAILVFSIPCAILVARSACPRCKFPLHNMGLRLRTGNIQRRINSCPGCGLDLDMDISAVSPDGAGSSQVTIRAPFFLAFGMVMVPAVLFLTNNDPHPLGAEPALVFLGLIGAVSAAFAFHRSARECQFPSVLVEPTCGAVCAVVFYSALSLLYHGLWLYAAICLALVLAVVVAWICPRIFGSST